jgi:hypothetical protein
VSQEIANESALKIIARLVEDDQLDESWAFVTATSARKIVFKGNREWEVVLSITKSQIQLSKRYMYF